MTLVDLRSDTVTQPTAAMRAAMLAAPLGDDVFADDLFGAEMFGDTGEDGAGFKTQVDAEFEQFFGFLHFFRCHDFTGADIHFGKIIIGDLFSDRLV